MKLKRNKKSIKNVNPSQPGLTYQAHDLGYETRITPQKSNRANYKAWFSINSLLNDKIEKKNQSKNKTQ
jgi:hypothetical protein